MVIGPWRTITASASRCVLKKKLFNPLLQPSRQLSSNMAVIKADLPVLPALSDGRRIEGGFKVLGKLSPPTVRKLEPVGPHFLAYARRVDYLSSNKKQCTDSKPRNYTRGRFLRTSEYKHRGMSRKWKKVMQARLANRRMS